jgi:transaldolase/glucose-6-phosphate isomerase
MFALVDRPNVMIKIPGTPEGVEAVATLIEDGINVNITLLFDVDVYEKFADAYLRGLEARHAAGLKVDTLASVASFFVSRVDTKVDERLAKDSPLRGRIAVANARLAYERFQKMFSGARWETLAAAGARLQRPLWASTSTKNPAYSDVLYVEELVAPHTVNTMTEATLQAFIEHGKVRPAIEEGMADARSVVEEARKAGIDLRVVGAELLDEGLAAFDKDFRHLLEAVEAGFHREEAAAPNAASGSLRSRLQAMDEQQIPLRIWHEDGTVWSRDGRARTGPGFLGWLHVAEQMAEEAPQLQRWARETAAGYENVLLLGMGGSCLAAEVMASSWPRDKQSPVLRAFDTSNPDEIKAVENEIDLKKTLFVVSSKSGTTIEMRSLMAHFWDLVPNGAQFIAITDPGTPLEATALEKGFRRVFPTRSDFGGRYSALSYYGLVPAALCGVDIEAVLDCAQEMIQACHHSLPAAENPGASLGAAIADAGLAGRDKLTLILPQEISALGDWVEQLIAESTGKEGTGIIPVLEGPVGSPETYGSDRLFVDYTGSDRLDALERAGHPVIRLPKPDPAQIGAEFFRWEFATVVVGHSLAINPFDQPNVQSAKDATDRFLLKGESIDLSGPSLDALLQEVKPGDYIALLAYLPRTDDNRRRLAAAQEALRTRYRTATTVAFGPRYLHSTGQLHKGGPNKGVFLQIAGESGTDVEIPGAGYGFRTLVHAQADGDLSALRALDRRAIRVELEDVERYLR